MAALAGLPDNGPAMARKRLDSGGVGGWQCHLTAVPPTPRPDAAPDRP
ncbi:hypothetical protein [Paracoccus jiaweipingae]